MSYYRGLQYEREKAKEKFKSNQHSGSDQNDHHQKTAQKLAKQHKVAQPTIRRDAQFARAVDNVAKAAANSAKAQSNLLFKPYSLVLNRLKLSYFKQV
jgi:hypothetical protein